jgi:surfeit locus 1 family protein
MKKYFSQRLIWLLLVIVLSAGFAKLGFWQLERSAEKSTLIQLQKQRADTVIDAPRFATSTNIEELQYRKVVLKGAYLPNLQWYLDNKTRHGKVGYHVISAFKTSQGFIVLINRGWVQGFPDRSQLPPIDIDKIDSTVEGIIYFPSKNQFISNRLSNFESFSIIPQIAFSQLEERIVQYAPNSDVANYTVLLSPISEMGYVREWKFANMPPEKHIAYAVQWFGISITIWVIFLILSFRKKRGASA